MFDILSDVLCHRFFRKSQPFEDVLSQHDSPMRHSMKNFGSIFKKPSFFSRYGPLFTIQNYKNNTNNKYSMRSETKNHVLICFSFSMELQCDLLHRRLHQTCHW